MTIQEMITTIRQALPPKGDIAVGQHFEANSGINAEMLHTVLDTLEELVCPDCGAINDLCICGTLLDYCDDCLELFEDCTCGNGVEEDDIE